MEGSHSFKLTANLARKKADTTKLLDKVIPYSENLSSTEQAARYSLDLDGEPAKTASRMRPIMTQMFAEAYNNPYPNGGRLSLATECIHAASLILDDLPSMDNAKLRRGRETTHRRYGEDIAVMASQMLINKSTQLINKYAPPTYKSALVEEATNVGNVMMNAQERDLKQDMVNRDEVREMYRGKSGELLALAVRLGTFHLDGTAHSTGRTWRKSQAYEFGRHLGFVFQIADDLKDHFLTSKETGKDKGKDKGKRTYILVSSNPQEAVDVVLREKEKLKEFVRGKETLEKLIDMAIRIPEIS